MARKKDKENEPIAVELPPAKRMARKVALWGFIAALGATAAGLGFNRLQQYVEKKYATPSRPPQVALKQVPAWMDRNLVDQVLRAARPANTSSAFDRMILADVRDQLLNDANVGPYIESINQIRRVYGGAPGDTIEIDATFRAPVALVRWGEDYWHVDSVGHKLVHSFTIDQLNRATMSNDGKIVTRVIVGVRTPPPTPGDMWRGADLQAGLDLLKLIHDKPFSQEIRAVDVSNFAGRNDAAAAQLILKTRYNTEIRWGRPLNSSEGFVEVDAGRKLAVLERIVAEYGQIDARRPWIDIRFDKPTIPRMVPGQNPEATQAADTR